MPKLSAPASCVLVLGLAGACTEHGRDEPPPDPRHEPAPEPPPPEPELPPEPEPPPEIARRGPVTPLSCKPFAGALGDLDGDRQPDVVALCHGLEAAALLVLGGAADGRFTEGAPTIVEASGLALGDLDGDGDLDVLLFDASGRPSYRVARNDGSGTLSLGPVRRIPGRYGGELRGASIIDLDGDEALDAVIPLWDTIRIMPGDGAGELARGRALAVGRDPFATALADLDGDARLDLIASSGAGPARDGGSYESGGASVWIYHGRGREQGFAEPVRVEVGGATQVAAADLDGDDRPEIVVSGSGGLTVIRDPLGQPQAKRTLVATDGPLLLADVLDTAAPELITTSYIQGRVHVLGGYPELQKRSIEAGSFVVGLFAADVARDGGHPDLVLLDAGPPGGSYGEPAPAIEVLFFDG